MLNMFATNGREPSLHIIGTGEAFGGVAMSGASAPCFIVSATAIAFSLSFASADEFGVATYYHNPRYGGLIAAHLRLPFGTRVRVYNLDNGRDAIVTIVDRGPFARGRIIDVSTVAADVLGMRQAGVARVRLEAMSNAVQFEP
jgi:rare lipoprotein A